MSLFWEPRWVRKKVSHAGIEIETCFDEVSKLYLCPLCVKIDELCPEGKETNVVSENIITFFTVEDLIRHLRSHAHKHLQKKIATEKLELEVKNENA